MTVLRQEYRDGMAGDGVAVDIVTTDRPAGRSGTICRSAVKPRFRACAILLSSTLFIGAAAAQTPYGPVVNGRQLQPTQEQLERTNDKNVVVPNSWETHWMRWNNRVAPEMHRLDEEIMRATNQS